MPQRESSDCPPPYFGGELIAGGRRWRAQRVTNYPPPTQSNKELVCDLFKAAFERGDLDNLAASVAADYLLHDAPPDMPRGPAGMLSFARWLRGGFAEVRVDIEDILAEGDRVAVRLMFHGHHTGEFMGRAATRRVVAYRHIHLVRLADGQVAEHWVCRDDISLMSQLGALPERPSDRA